MPSNWNRTKTADEAFLYAGEGMDVFIKYGFVYDFSTAFYSFMSSVYSFGCLNGFASHGSISQTYLKKIGFGIL